jgi:hypothetical protein
MRTHPKATRVQAEIGRPAEIGEASLLNKDVSGITVIHSQPSAEANDSAGAALSS